MSTKKTEIEQIYIGSYQRLLTKARQMLKDDDDAYDAVSDVFAKVAEGSLKLPEGHEESHLLLWWQENPSYPSRYKGHRAPTSRKERILII